jgi:sialic acid synthase
MRKLIIDSVEISDSNECYVIAEVGHNHQGNLQKAKDMFRSAKECGANAVKLQKRDNHALFTKALYDSPYDNENSFGATYGAHREALEFGREDYVELRRYSRELNLTLFATAFDFPSADFLADLDMPAYKIASGDIKNIPLLQYIAKIEKPIILSTGGATYEDIQRAVEAILPINSQVCILQCTASYPVEPEDMNLRVITVLREMFPDLVIGLSDHQSGIAMAMVAYTLGARIIEKHFTLNRAWKGTDQAFSLEPVGLRKLVRDLQRAHVAIGDGVKRPLPCETRSVLKMSKKLVAGRDLVKGHQLTFEDIAIKSPGDGMPPYELSNIVGKVIIRSLSEDENICWDDLLDGGNP